MSKTFDRKMLAQFLPNQESIRAFEQLLRATGEGLPDQIKEALDAAKDALAKYEALMGEEGASRIGFTPAGELSATNVSRALSELDAEKASIEKVQSFAFNIALGAGSGDALTATFVPALTGHINGALLLVRTSAANSSAAPTLAINGLSAVPIVKGGGLPLAASDIVAGAWAILSYDEILQRYVLHNPASPISTKVIAQSINGGALAGRRNRIMNGSFRINQRGVGSSVVLAANAYGHDG